MDNPSIYDEIINKQNEYENFRRIMDASLCFIENLNEDETPDFIFKIAEQCKIDIENAISEHLHPRAPEPIAEPEKPVKKPHKYVKKTIFNTPILKFPTEKEVRIEILNMINLCKEKGFDVTVEPTQRRGPQFQILHGYFVRIREIDGDGPWQRMISYKKAFDRLHGYLQTKGLR